MASDPVGPQSPAPPNYLGRAFGIPSWRYMVTLARSQRTGVLHYISDFICFGVLFLLFKYKKKKKICYTCFEICVQCYNINRNDLLWLTKKVVLKPVADSRLRQWPRPGCCCPWKADEGLWVWCQFLKHTQLYSSLWCCFTRCLWKCSFVSGYLLCAIFLLASRYN